MTRALGTQTRAAGERDDVVELPDALELLGRDELLQKARTRQRAFGELLKRPGARLVIGWPPKHESEGCVDELLVRALADGNVLPQPGVDVAHAYS